MSTDEQRFGWHPGGSLPGDAPDPARAEFEKIGTPAGDFSKSLVEYIARSCHEVNRAYCAALGDHSQPAWEDAPDWQKDSAMAGVRMHMTNPDATPAASHEAWMAQKLSEGWRWGVAKDPALKTHHCIVPFSDLPREQQAKDYVFRAVVHMMAGLPP